MAAKPPSLKKRSHSSQTASATSGTACARSQVPHSLRSHKKGEGRGKEEGRDGVMKMIFFERVRGERVGERRGEGERRRNRGGKGKVGFQFIADLFIFLPYTVHTVDRFQGDENEMIVVSLVRFNAEDKLGFAAIPNRICVALSRAQCGLYIIGQLPFFEVFLPTIPSTH